jgi:hypothetical protein
VPAVHLGMASARGNLRGIDRELHCTITAKVELQMSYSCCLPCLVRSVLGICGCQSHSLILICIATRISVFTAINCLHCSGQSLLGIRNVFLNEHLKVALFGTTLRFELVLMLLVAFALQCLSICSMGHTIGRQVMQRMAATHD